MQPNEDTHLSIHPTIHSFQSGECLETARWQCEPWTMKGVHNMALTQHSRSAFEA